MTEFHTILHERAREALARLSRAVDLGDDYSVDVLTGELDSIQRLADDHDVRLPELDAYRGAPAA
ncbi:MAG: hypothetical protein M3Y71_03145 [Actinomycetota bacterium]|nr:hypothetical protein [Actinomycetota bacterium]